MPALDLFPFVRPLLHRLDSETAHTLTLRILERGLVPARPAITGSLLATTFLGRSLPHPIGLAAGFDRMHASTRTCSVRASATSKSAA
jgi:dihydroorotate dehydrogenase